MKSVKIIFDIIWLWENHCRVLLPEAGSESRKKSTVKVFMFFWICGIYGIGYAKCMDMIFQRYNALHPQCDQLSNINPSFQVVQYHKCFANMIFCLYKNPFSHQWSTTEPEFNEQFVFMTNIVDLPKQVEKIKLFHCFREIGDWHFKNNH